MLFILLLNFQPDRVKKRGFFNDLSNSFIKMPIKCHTKLKKCAETHIDIGKVNESILIRPSVCIKGLIISHCSRHHQCDTWYRNDTHFIHNQEQILSTDWILIMLHSALTGIRLLLQLQVKPRWSMIFTYLFHRGWILMTLNDSKIFRQAPMNEILTIVRLEKIQRSQRNKH